ncbi:hypothetical protein [Chryseobacterium takakiae]|uniref:Uncharacterized protein n=1 Tax=Chryseobacterium takakiae TaxID=1302685 RepID=A0A1M4TGM0_9FLAO|nr:hypothetical protein [Chryseobacterium takakiae]SHE43447.1 hypothetical protein SAMN05444408_101367 [Chryseobacterium takakiae]
MAKKKNVEHVQISLTDFIDYVSKIGTTKFTKVKEIKNRDPYHPAFDFWKPLREKIVEIHKENKNKNLLNEVMNGLTDKNKINLYPHLITQYKSFLGKKKLEWIEPPFADWKMNDLRIKINPEVGLFINDKPYIIKLYFKSESLSKSKADLILLMMNENLKKGDFIDANFAILDISKKKLYENSSLNSIHLSLIEGEALSFLKIWDSI